jgi:hypothetical protein
MQQGGHAERNIHKVRLRDKRQQPQRLALAFNAGVVRKPARDLMKLNHKIV